MIDTEKTADTFALFEIEIENPKSLDYPENEIPGFFHGGLPAEVIEEIIEIRDTLVVCDALIDSSIDLDLRDCRSLKDLRDLEQKWVGWFRLEKEKMPKEIHLNNLNLSQVPGILQELEGVKGFNFTDNAICEIPEWLYDTGASELIFASNGFTKIPWEIGRMQNLKTLVFQSNAITEIPSSIAGIEGLKKLDLSGNQISAIPPKIGAMQSLETLLLTSNRIGSIPKQFAFASALKLVNLSENRIYLRPDFLHEDIKLILS